MKWTATSAFDHRCSLVYLLSESKSQGSDIYTACSTNIECSSVIHFNENIFTLPIVRSFWVVYQMWYNDNEWYINYSMELYHNLIYNPIMITWYTTTRCISVTWYLIYLYYMYIRWVIYLNYMYTRICTPTKNQSKHSFCAASIIMIVII